jgi:molybdenum cofactor guanylyltransferase
MLTRTRPRGKPRRQPLRYRLDEQHTTILDNGAHNNELNGNRLHDNGLRVFTMSNAHHSSITAVILAGGASLRMGRNKALLEWQGRPFVAHIAERLRTQVGRVAINTNAAAEFAQFGLPLVADATTEKRGPLAGILAALNYSSSEWTLVVPCDNPLISTQLVDRLLDVIEQEGSDIAFATSEHDNHYLYALMRTELRGALTVFMSGADFAVRHWYATQHVSRVDFSDEADCFRNINTAEDLALLSSR